MNDGFDELGTHDTDGSFMGFDYMSLIKGGAGMLSGAGGMLSGGGGGAAGGGADAERRRLEDERRRLEKSKTTWMIVGIVAAVVGLGGVALAMRKPAP